MLYTISWMVQRDPQLKHSRVQSGVLSSFLAGGLVGGALIGALLAAIARGLFDLLGSQPTAFAVAITFVAIVYAGRAANIWHAPKPQFHHQVPEAWRNIFEPRVASFLYSGGLGTIYFTRLASVAAYPLALLLLGMGSAPLAVIEIMAAVGLTRAATAFAVPFLRLDTKSSDVVPTFIERHSPTVRRGDVLMMIYLMLLFMTWLGVHYLH